MALPAILMGIGAGMNIIGGLLGNQAASSQERENAQFYEEQAQLAEFAARRAADLASSEYTIRASQQVSKYAQGGAALTGSALLTVGGTIADYYSEVAAIEKRGRLEASLARKRGEAASSRADTLSDPFFNIMSAGGSMLNFAASGADKGWFSSSGGTTSATSPASIGGGFYSRSNMAVE